MTTEAEMLSKFARPDVSIIVDGELVQGEMTPMVSRLIALRADACDLPDNADEAAVDALFAAHGFSSSAA